MWVVKWMTYRNTRRGRSTYVEYKHFKHEMPARKFYASICQRGFPEWATLEKEV